MDMIRQYINDWWTVMLRPILFYTVRPKENWQEQPQTFLLITAWLLALGGALVIFIVQYIPIGSTLVVNVPAWKFIFIIPVMAVLAFVFFMITFLILGGVFTVGLFAAYYLNALVLNYVYKLLGGKDNADRMVQNMFYSCAAMLSLFLAYLLMIITKYGGLPYDLFRVGFNFTYFLTLLYSYGLWAIIGKRTADVPKWKAFLGALAPIIILLIFGFLFDKIALPKLQSWIT